MPSLAVTAARVRLGGVPNRTTPAPTAPTAPANITHAPIAKGQTATLSPVHPLGTVKES